MVKLLSDFRHLYIRSGFHELLTLKTILSKFYRWSFSRWMTISASIMDETNKRFLKFGILFDNIKYCCNRFFVCINKISLDNSALYTQQGSNIVSTELYGHGHGRIHTSVLSSNNRCFLKNLNLLNDPLNPVTEVFFNKSLVFIGRINICIVSKDNVMSRFG